MNEDQIQRELKDHAAKIAVSDRESWFMKPIPLWERERDLRWRAFVAQATAFNQQQSEIIRCRSSTN